MSPVRFDGATRPWGGNDGDLSDTTNHLKVIGDAGDTVDLVGAWTDGGINGAFHTYTQGAATILIDADVFVI